MATTGFLEKKSILRYPRTRSGEKKNRRHPRAINHHARRALFSQTAKIAILHVSIFELTRTAPSVWRDCGCAVQTKCVVWARAGVEKSKALLNTFSELTKGDKFGRTLHAR